MKHNKKVNKILIITFALIAALCIIGGIRMRLQKEPPLSLLPNVIVLGIASGGILVNLLILKGKLIFPAGILKFIACIGVYSVLIFFITKDVIIKDILTGSVGFETVLAFLLLLLSVIGGWIVLPKYLRTNVRLWNVLQRGKGTDRLIKSITEVLPQTTYIYAKNGVTDIGGKCPYIESDETFVLSDSKNILAKELFTLSHKNKLNLYYSMHISRAELLDFLQQCLYYGFETFTFASDEGAVKIPIREIVTTERDFIECSETAFLHNYYIFNQKNARRAAMLDAHIAMPEEEIFSVKEYAQKSLDAFGDALFFVYCAVDDSKGGLFVSKQAQELLPSDDAALYPTAQCMDITKASVLYYIFSKESYAKSFAANTKRLSIDDELQKWSEAHSAIAQYQAEEQETIRRNYKYYTYIDHIQKEMDTYALCLVTGEELKQSGNTYLLDTDCIVPSKGTSVYLSSLAEAVGNA